MSELAAQKEKEYIMAEGMAKGKAEGKVEGKAEGKAEIARNLKKKGYKSEEIFEITGLSKKEINKL